jgi:hypothetical protein
MKIFGKIASVVILLLSTNALISQSTSVFDANYFNKDNTVPPIKIA